MWDVEQIDEPSLRLEELVEIHQTLAGAYTGLGKTQWSEEQRALAQALVEYRRREDGSASPEAALAKAKTAYQAASVPRGGDRVRSGTGRARRPVSDARETEVAGGRPVSPGARVLRARPIGSSGRGSATADRARRRDGVVPPSGAATGPNAHQRRGGERGEARQAERRVMGDAASDDDRHVRSSLRRRPRSRARNEDFLGAFEPDDASFSGRAGVSSSSPTGWAATRAETWPVASRSRRCTTPTTTQGARSRCRRRCARPSRSRTRPSIARAEWPRAKSRWERRSPRWSSTITRPSWPMWETAGPSLIRGRQIRQLTEDHSLVAELVREGVLSATEAEHHPSAHVVLRSPRTSRRTSRSRRRARCRSAVGTCWCSAPTASRAR